MNNIKFVKFDNQYVNSNLVEKIMLCTKETKGWNGVVAYINGSHSLTERFDSPEEATHRCHEFLRELSN